MRARFEEGRWNKAERGELGFNLPRGFLRRPSGEIILDPDERVRDTLRLVFDTFERRRSAHGVVRYLFAHEIDLPDRARHGPAKGEITWRPPTRVAVLGILTNPAYAGAYAYGRRAVGPSPGRPERRIPRHGDWRGLLKDRLPAYIPWETYERNQRQLAANRSKHVGVARGGPSLLAGLLVCGRCGYRMATNYRTNARGVQYSCTRLQVNRGEAACQCFAGRTLDAFVTDLVLAALRPSAIEVSLQLAEDIELERTRQHRHWTLRLERARYEVERAELQYGRVEPENRLVARTLEKRWEGALAAKAELEAEHARFMAREPARLTAAEGEQIRRLAEDIPAIRGHPGDLARPHDDADRAPGDRPADARPRGGHGRRRERADGCGVPLGRRVPHLTRGDPPGAAAAPAPAPPRARRQDRGHVRRRLPPARDRAPAQRRGLAHGAQPAVQRERGPLAAPAQGPAAGRASPPERGRGPRAG